MPRWCPLLREGTPRMTQRFYRISSLPRTIDSSRRYMFSGES